MAKDHKIGGNVRESLWRRKVGAPGWGTSFRNFLWREHDNALFRHTGKIIQSGIKTFKPFTVDPRPFDPENVNYSFLERILFKFIYGKQEKCEDQLKKLGLLNDKAFSCTCYLDEVGNIPQKGQYLAWSESSAVVYANSVIGARTNRNSAGIDVLCNVLGKAPYFGFLTDEGRKASWRHRAEGEQCTQSTAFGQRHRP